MSNTTSTQPTGFAWNQYQRPVATPVTGAQGNFNFFRPEDSKLPTGAALGEYLAPAGAPADQVTNRTIKYDGALTREQMGNQTDFLNKQMGTGFAGVNTGLGTVNQNLGTLDANMNTGFKATNENLGTVNTGVTNVGNQVTKGNEANTAGFAGLNTQFGKAFDQLTALGTTANTNYNALAAAQQKAQGGLDTLGGDFKSFRGDYNTNTARNDQAQTQLKNQISGAVGTIGNQITGGNAQIQGGIDELGKQGFAGLGGGSPQARGAASMMGNVVGASGFAGGQRPQGGSPSSVPTAPANGIMDGVMRMSNILQTQGQQIGPELFGAFSQIVGSFDQNGALIPSSQSPSGITTRREMDPSGNLVSSQFGPDGQVLSQNLLNLNASMAAANQF